MLGIGRCFDGLISIEDMHMFGELRPKPDARMLRTLLARLRVPAARCVLVEDTLQHQKSARRVGMSTVWMQRWTPRRRPAGCALQHAAGLCGREGAAAARAAAPAALALQNRPITAAGASP